MIKPNDSPAILLRKSTGSVILLDVRLCASSDEPDKRRHKTNKYFSFIVPDRAIHADSMRSKLPVKWSKSGLILLWASPIGASAA